jgi:hypothetical protein
VRIDPKDKPLLLALLSIPFALVLLVATLPLLPQQPEQNAGQAQASQSGGGKISALEWFLNWSAEDYIALFTMATLGVLAMQFRSMIRSNEHFRVSERAYLQISHTDGLELTSYGLVKVPLQIKNWGNTPGEVVDQCMGYYRIKAGDKLPASPPYGELVKGPPTGAFLIPTGIMTWRQDFMLGGTTPATTAKEINDGQLELYVIGYVDYRDKFGTLHRGGYARRYIPGREGSKNLVFVSVPNYNYDWTL